LRLLPRTISSVGVALATLPLALGALATPGLTPQAIAAQGQTALASPQPLPTAQINGVVWDQTIVGNVVYVVGEFNQARPAGSPDKQNESPRSNAMAYDITTGEMLDWAPQLNAAANAIEASPDGSTLYIGGKFTSVNGQPASRLAAVDTAGQYKPLNGGTPGGAVSPNGTVRDLELSPDGSTLYMAGLFTQVNDLERLRAAALDLKTQQVTSFAPRVDDESEVRTITVAADGSAIAIGGSFKTVEGSSDAYGMAILEKDGALRHTNLAKDIRNAGSMSGIMSMKSDSKGLYGTAYSMEGFFEGMFRADWNTGDINLMADCHGDSYDVLPTNDVIYVSSHTHDCSNIGGVPDRAQEGVYYHAIAFSSDATGTVGTNTANGYADFAGHPAPTQYNEFLPGFANGEYTASKQATWTVEGNDDYLIYGGEFVAVNGISQQGLVRFSLKGDKKEDKKEDKKGDKNEGKKPEEEKGKNDDKNDWGDPEDDWNDEEDQHGWDERNGDHDGWNNNQHGWWW